MLQILHDERDFEHPGAHEDSGGVGFAPSDRPASHLSTNCMDSLGIIGTIDWSGMGL